MAAPDMSPLLAVVEFGSVVTAIANVAGILCTVYVVWKGAKLVIAAVRGDAGEDYWDGYTAEDDARDRAAGGLDK